ncbi:MAG: reverse transcriptase family protein [Mycobacteriales bacterium]
MGREPHPWPVPSWVTPDDLAAALEVEAGTLAWLADGQGRLRRHGTDHTLHHYRRWARTGARGAIRVIEAPKPRLRAAQRLVLREVVAAVPAHDAAHGFRSGRGVASFAAPHVGRPVVVHLDLVAFFAHVTAPRVAGIFRMIGYDAPVARLLAGLTTTATPYAMARHLLPGPDRAGIRAALAVPHLPQGAPTSPALANLAAYDLDARLAGLAAKLGIGYSRYADDLAFSGPAYIGELVPRIVAGIVAAEGFRLNVRKMHVARRSGAQRLTGLVVNDRLNTPRTEYDVLRATLHRCALHGPAAENRAGVEDFRAHLLGRISWIASINGARGAKLHALVARIDWSR